MDQHQRIVIDPAVLAGKPSILGTRLSVELIIGWMAQGWTVENFLDNYPALTRDDVLAALAFAADALRRDTPAIGNADTRVANAWAGSATGADAAAPMEPDAGTHERIVATPDTLSGRARIAGPRIGVDFLLDLLGSGWHLTRIIDEYPHLKPDDVRAALAHAQAVIRKRHGP